MQQKRNGPENIYGYYDRVANMADPERYTLEHLPERLQAKYKDMKQITILGNRYYTIPTGKDMGKSEKILLISHTSFAKSVLEGTDLKPDALLKLPKNGVITQVQSEGMALGIASQALDLTTASATMVCFQGKPALFVPFEDMQPLTKFAAGDTAIVRDRGRVDYDNSSINPLGSGLSANTFINDFGAAFALMYLTGDPDGVGGYNQNKGLLGRDLYIFDQAISGHDSIYTHNHFQIDSRLRQTSSTLASFSRHTRGRNFSLLEDASIEEKFDSLSPAKCAATLEYITQVINGMRAEMLNVPQELKAQHAALITSAENAHALITARIEAYNRMLPRAINSPEKETIKQALVLENILNHPRMYSVTGRPYRSLLTTLRDRLKVDSVEAIDGSNNVKITFNKPLDGDTLHLINKRLPAGRRLYDHATKSITIDKDLLINLEKTFYPETDHKINQDVNYIDSSGTRNLSKSYSVTSTYCMRVIEHYTIQQKDAKANANDQKIILNIQKARSRLSAPEHAEAHDKGFNCHMIRRFEFEAQKELQHIISKNIDNYGENTAAFLLEIQNQAFSSAVQLDCIQEFNNICIHAAENISNSEIRIAITHLFEKYSCLHLSNLSIDDALYIRSEMIQDINDILKLNPQLHTRQLTQASYKEAAASARAAGLDIHLDAPLRKDGPTAP